MGYCEIVGYDEELTNRIPSRSECLHLMEATDMLDNIRAHSLVVEALAITIARMCIDRGYDLNIELVSAGALLHDIAKTKCIAEKCNHAKVGGEIVRSWGYPKVAQIVEEHISLCMADIISCPTETLIVNYADKRVLHDRVVSLDKRFEDLISRYGTTEEKTRILKYKWYLYKKLEERFSKVTGVNMDELKVD